MEQASERGKLTFPLALAAHISLFPADPLLNLAGNLMYTQAAVFYSLSSREARVKI